MTRTIVRSEASAWLCYVPLLVQVPYTYVTLCTVYGSCIPMLHLPQYKCELYKCVLVGYVKLSYKINENIFPAKIYGLEYIMHTKVVYTYHEVLLCST
jgi:hypothetical protein